jgi:glycosyltransferase involved in cell wall biosynthesis
MYKNKTVSLVFPVYNEELNIRKAIDDFFSTHIVDEIIAVDNNSKDNSKIEILKTNARYVLEQKQGYGFALMHGLQESKGDIIFLCEPDGTFSPKDIEKFLIYLEDGEFDVVFGTRTNKAMIVDNAKMDNFLRYGNIFVAKLMSIHAPFTLTDVGCTFRCITREGYNEIKEHLTIGDSTFSPHFMLECLIHSLDCVEIPVWYLERVGESKITSNFGKSFKLGLRMIWLIIKRKFSG